MTPEVPAESSSFMGAIRYWETRRIVYNLILVAVVMAWLVGTWPHFRPALSWANLLRLCVLGGIANLLYCAAYLVEFPIQLTVSGAPGAALNRVRTGVWVIGTVFAFLLTNYWIADEIYPYVD